jgi:ABC-type polar amino acid transport system ATPase subunit
MVAVSASDAPVVAELRDIRKSFGSTEVLHGIDLTVRQGQHVVLFGPSGSGKSTVLRTMNLLEQPDSGSVKVNGIEYGPGLPGDKAPKGKPLALRQSLGMVFQQFNLFPHMTALHNIAVPLQIVRKLSRKDAEDRAADALRDVGLLKWAGQYPTQLSGGQQQRVAIARALAQDPQIMLFDEPTSSLDPELVGEVLAVMRRLAQSGMTMVVVTHEINFAREIGDLCVFMEDGLVVEASGREIFDHSEHARTRQFIGSVL